VRRTRSSTSKRARTAFDVSKESPSFAEPFGKTPFGMSCLLATRLVEAGGPLRDGLVRRLGHPRRQLECAAKASVAAFGRRSVSLGQRAESKGLLDSTVILMTGEFGRTPKINPQRNGRDHYPRAMFQLMAGGGIRGGQVLGATDDKGLEPTHDPHSPDDVAATFYRTLGIDPTKEYHTNRVAP